MNVNFKFFFHNVAVGFRAFSSTTTSNPICIMSMQVFLKYSWSTCCQIISSTHLPFTYNHTKTYWLLVGPGPINPLRSPGSYGDHFCRNTAFQSCWSNFSWWAKWNKHIFSVAPSAAKKLGLFRESIYHLLFFIRILCLNWGWKWCGVKELQSIYYLLGFIQTTTFLFIFMSVKWKLI